MVPGACVFARVFQKQRQCICHAHLWVFGFQMVKCTHLYLEVLAHLEQDGLGVEMRLFVCDATLQA